MMKSVPQKVLHVGCGYKSSGVLHPLFTNEGWEEIRVDIDPAVEPDIVASITNLIEVQSETMDALYSSHNLEHLFAHEVPLALKEFMRVLRPEGFALITVPDLMAAARMIAEDKLQEEAYNSPAGPVTPLDIVYGYGPSIAQGRIHMAHKTGFTEKTLGQIVMASGFAWAKIASDSGMNLWIKAYKNTPSKEIAAQPIF